MHRRHAAKSERLVTENHPPAYLSPSRLSAYEWCPQEFRRRYVLGIKEPTSPEMCFGTAVHAGIEALMLGDDAELAFVRKWRELQIDLTANGLAFSSALTARGLELLDMVVSLNLAGDPERQVMYTHPGIIIPLLGYVDLWGDNHIVDFKTTAFGWKQKKADAQVFQPAIYSQAYLLEHGTIPKFTFVVLPRIAGPMHLLDGSRSAEQIQSAFERIKEIHELIEAEVFGCTCKKHTEAAA